MVEQSHAGEGHGNAVLVAFFDYQIVTDGAAGLCNVLNTGSNTALDGVGDGASWECLASRPFEMRATRWDIA